MGTIPEDIIVTIPEKLPVLEEEVVVASISFYTTET